MIYHLRRRFIRICTLSFLGVFIVLFAAMSLITALQTNHALDTLADIITESGGQFPDYDDLYPAPNDAPHGITRESPFTTRYFSVHYDTDGHLRTIDTGAIASVDHDAAEHYAQRALAENSARGWIDDYRYKVTTTTTGTDVLFISGAGERAANTRFLVAASAVFLGASLIILLCITLLSKRAVRPIADAYDKQKQFITDSSHELKTPLTLIRTNLDILEEENGPSTWLDDIRAETDNMTDLVNHLVHLARMDEHPTDNTFAPFNLSDTAAQLADTFAPLASQKGLHLEQNIAPNIMLNGDERAIGQLLGILLDNACKYCTPAGTIRLRLSAGRHPLLILDNTCQDAPTTASHRLFDRFYREDRARTAGSGFGLGLSIAKAICDRHHATITAQALNNHTIRFKVRF